MKNGKLYSFKYNLLLSLSGVILFYLSHPNKLVLTGIPVFGYIALAPFFLLIKRTSLKFSVLWGAFSGFLSYLAFNFWILFFHQAAVYVITGYYLILYALLFALLKIVDIFFPRYGFIFQALVWVGYEYVKTLGFMGYPYGIIGYTQWNFPTLIRSSAVLGVWGISLLLVFFSSISAVFIYEFTLNKSLKTTVKLYGKYTAIWLGCFCAFFLYGIFAKTDYSSYKKAKLALIQPNTDPWVGNIEVYKNNFYDLKTLSEKAVAENSDISLVVWPETAFIPRIKWHYKYSSDMQSAALVRNLLEFLNGQTVPYLIGNDDAVPIGETGEGRLDYNAAMLFVPSKNVIPPEPDTYRKMHLVPFTEHFPYKNIFPFIYRLLEKSDTHFWERGEERFVFNINGIKFGTPICFEDCFGYISADFVKKGADLIVNMTNDAWAKSAVPQYQHLSMAVFRAAENKVPVVRAASSGQTAYIDPNGEIKAMLKPFSKDILTVEVPILTETAKTVYSFAGDYFAVIISVVTFSAVIAAAIKRIYLKLRS
ncbi:apolipoprotein N-acyltransferase [Treponema pedis]|uniref:apolipoprotein N-acyltransferase n=1 Tax=Treponema pedis TaxID=409322 RepID=UPI0031341555